MTVPNPTGTMIIIKLHSQDIEMMEDNKKEDQWSLTLQVKDVDTWQSTSSNNQEVENYQNIAIHPLLIWFNLDNPSDWKKWYMLQIERLSN